jgi:glycosyltransferase involved in cell wall biosynthesis
MNILMISPNAPPKNSPESMQVGRYLQELDKSHHITLVTTPVERGWVAKDDSLNIKLTRTDVISLHYPFYRFFVRLLRLRFFGYKSLPDNDSWICLQASWLLKKIEVPPDILYSRSQPFSSALLAREVKKKTNLPWIMHLSDPWADGPYRSVPNYLRSKDHTYERICFSSADLITVTTDEFRAFYIRKYPEFTEKIKVIPNAMPDECLNVQPEEKLLVPTEFLDIVHTGAFYGSRRPTPILRAMECFQELYPHLSRKIRLFFVGNMNPDVVEEIKSADVTNIEVLGSLSYQDTRKLQQCADILLSIEPTDDHELLKGVLLSKIVDYIAMRKPILAITPEGSVSAKLCARGYGWAVDPRRVNCLTQLLSEIMVSWEKNKRLPLLTLPDLPEEFTVTECVNRLNRLIASLVK